MNTKTTKSKRTLTAHLGICLISILLLLIPGKMIAGEKPPFALTIVPTDSNVKEGGWIYTAEKETSTFYVVLTNNSDHPQPVWSTSHSWGFWTISFEFIMADGKHIVVSKNRHEDFLKNFPSTFIIPPGEHQIYPIRLNADWDNRPTAPTYKSPNDFIPVTVKAIYKVDPTPESTKYKVWTGQIESESYKFILDH